MAQFRKNPEPPVTAMQLPSPSVRPIAELASELKTIAEWCGGVVYLISPDIRSQSGVEVNTIRGTERARLGSWIVKDAAGNFAIYEGYQFDQLFTPVED